LRRDLAAAEARVLAGDAGAAGDVELLVLSIRHLLRDRDAIRREVIEICARAGRAGFLERRTTRGHGGPPPWHKNRNRPPRSLFRSLQPPVAPVIGFEFFVTMS
jgi:hypothetical protein